MLHFFPFPFPQEPIVNKDGCELFSDGAVYNFRCNSGINTSRHCRDDSIAADAFFDFINFLRNKVSEFPSCRAFAYVKQKVGKYFFSAGGMTYFRVELDSENGLGAVADGGVGSIWRCRNALEAGWKLRDVIAVGHPHGNARGHFMENASFVSDMNGGRAVFPPLSWLNLSPQRMGDELEAVADAKDRNAKGESFFFYTRRIAGVH